MNGTIGVAVLALSVGLAPVPADPTPDPLAWGFLGVVSADGSLRLSEIQDGTPAAKAGILAGDEFVQVGELRPKSFEQVSHHIRSFRPGSVLKVEVRRGGESKTFTVKLGARPSDSLLPLRPSPFDDPER